MFGKQELRFRPKVAFQTIVLSSCVAQKVSEKAEWDSIRSIDTLGMGTNVSVLFLILFLADEIKPRYRTETDYFYRNPNRPTRIFLETPHAHRRPVRIDRIVCGKSATLDP